MITRLLKGANTITTVRERDREVGEDLDFQHHLYLN
jgi:hypothetical protein